MQTKRKKQHRREGRDEAARRLDDVARHAVEVRRNDTMGSHYSMWLADGARVDWWPGTRHWRADGQDFRGSVDDLIDWLRGARVAA